MLKTIYRGFFYTKMGYGQIAFLLGIINVFLLIRLVFNLQWIVLVIFGIVAFMGFIFGGRWFVKTPYGPFMIDSKVRNKYSALNQMILHFWVYFSKLKIDWRYQLDELEKEKTLNNDEKKLMALIEKCEREWLLEEF